MTLPAPEIGSDEWLAAREVEWTERDARYDLLVFIIKLNKLPLSVFYSRDSFYKYGALRPYRVRLLAHKPVKYRSFSSLDRLESYVSKWVWHTQVAKGRTP